MVSQSEMITEIHSSETPSAADAGGYDQSLAPRDSADGDAIISSSAEVNMTNCYKHCEHFFKRCKDGMIHHDALIAYWMIAGYLGTVESIDEAYKKGNRLLRNLAQGGLLESSYEDPEMIELVGSTDSKSRSQPIPTCRHGLTPCDAKSAGFVEMLDVDRIEKVVLTDGMMKQRNRSDDGNYLCRQVFQSQRGLKYVAHFNPAPNSLKPLLASSGNPSVLMLRGCSDHLFPMRDFPFEKFKTLTVLEISGSGILNTVLLHGTISKLTQLRYLYLSDPLIDSLPEGLFTELLQLRWLILRGCSRLDFNLDISHLQKLEVLDLSDTSSPSIPSMSRESLTHVFVRDSALTSYIYDLAFQPRIKVLDLSGNQNLEKLHRFVYGYHLVVLDLSRTRIKVIDFLVNTIHLRNLILRKCTSLEELPRMNTLTNLEVLDVSGCENLLKLPEDVSNLKNMKELNLAGCSSLENLGEGFFDQMFCLLKLDLSAIKFKHLPSFASLTSLQTLNLSKTSVAKLPDISMLVSLKELLLADCRNLKVVPDLQPLTSLETLDVSFLDDPTIQDCKLEVEHQAQRVLPLSLHGNSSKKLAKLQGQRTISKAVEFHVVYDVEHTTFDCFIYEFERIDALISNIQRSSTRKIGKTNSNQANYFERHFEMLHADMKYIRENIERLKGSRDSKSSEELLQELVDASINLSAADFKDDSPNLKQLLRLVIRLKLLLAPMQINDQEASDATKKKQPLFTKIAQNAAEIGEDLSITEHHLVEINGLRLTYRSLTNIQKNCLLCFSAFPCNEEAEENTGVFKKSLVIKKTILIYWWVCEGFIDPHYHKIHKDSLARAMKDLQTIEDIGTQILQVLVEKGFIEPVIKKRRKLGSFRMHHHVHSFVTEEARIEGFFDFDREKNNCLNPYVTRSKKDCLRKTQDKLPGSTELLANRTNSQKELESVRNVFTLFNLYGSVVDIKREWFSEMKQLTVLSLGSWGCSENVKHIEIVDQKFLEELKSMKQLRLISLQGLTTIMKLPDSICKLTNLIILDLRECGYLEELPLGIGSLKNLTHLDLTDCVVLNKMPKGISLLSNLEVLRGFKITHEPDAVSDQNTPNHMMACVSVNHGKDNEACTLRDLSKLKRLNKLSLVVKIKEFPRSGDVEILMGMKRLRKLKILWERSFYSDNASGSRTSSYMTLEETETYYPWALEKLELWCLPYKTLPDWVHPMKFANLEELYIAGGDLVEFRGVTWSSLKTLRLKYLREMREVSRNDFKRMFPMLTYMEIKECFFCSNSIWWNEEERIWAMPSTSFPGRFLRKG